LIRHGENVDGKTDADGPIVDLGLTDLGRRQVERLCERLHDDPGQKSSALLSSPERRAAESADEISKALHLTVETDDRLSEWRSDDGTLSADEFMTQWRALREQDKANYRIQPKAETQAEFFARVGDCLSGIVKRYEGKTVIVITHGGFIQASYRHFFGFGDAAFRRAYAACNHTGITMWREEKATGRWILEYSNDSRHLDVLRL